MVITASAKRRRIHDRGFIPLPPGLDGRQRSVGRLTDYSVAESSRGKIRVVTAQGNPNPVGEGWPGGKIVLRDRRMVRIRSDEGAEIDLSLIHISEPTRLLS